MQEEEDISLVDLLVVLIRHRFIILGLTAAAAVIAGVVFFALPLLGLVTFGTYTIKLEALVSQLPPALAQEIALSPASLAASYALEPDSVTEAVKRHGIVKIPVRDTEGWMLHTYITRSFIGKEYKVVNKGTSLGFEVLVKAPEAGKAFLLEMLDYADERTKEILQERSIVISESMESLYKEVSGSSPLSDSAKQLIISSEPYKNKRVPALVLSGKPVVLINAQDGAKNTAIIILAGFFLSVFLAFVIEYVENLKADPDASEKIRKALDK